MELYNKLLTNETFREKLDVITEVEKDRKFCRHGIEHILDVARIAQIFNVERGYNLSKDIVYSASLLHDIGRADEYLYGTPHDEAGAQIATNILMELGANGDEIFVISYAIGHHRGQNLYGQIDDKNPSKLLSNIIKEADVISRPCYMCKASAECKWPEEKKNNIIKY